MSKTQQFGRSWQTVETRYLKAPLRKALLDSRPLDNDGNSFCMPQAARSSCPTFSTTPLVFDSKRHTRLATPEKLNIQIFLRQCADDQEIEISQHCCTTSHHTLDDYEKTSGNYSTKLRTSTSSVKARKIANLISARTIARSDGWIAYRSIYFLSMSYRLPSNSFTR